MGSTPQGAGRPGSDDREPDFPHASLGYQINVAARAARAVLDDRLAAHDITFATWIVLILLATRGPLIQRQLAAAADVEAPTMFRKIEQLQAAGLVMRRPSPTDRRALVVSLTADGAALYRRVKSSVQAAETDLTQGLSPTELETVRRALQKMVDRAAEMVATA